MTSRRRVLPSSTVPEKSSGPGTSFKAKLAPINLEATLEKIRGNRKQRECCSDISCNGSEIKVSSPTYALDLMSQLYQLYLDGICCDVVLSTGDYQTTVHKVVLMASSEYFGTFFQSHGFSCDFMFLPSDITKESLQAMITFLYTGALFLNFDNILFLLTTAERLQIKTAIDLCNKFWSDNRLALDNLGLRNVTIALDKVIQVPNIEIKTEVSSDESTEISEEWSFARHNVEHLPAASPNVACTESPKVESVPKRKRGRPPKNQLKCIQTTESAPISSLKSKTEKVLCKLKNDEQKHSNLKPHNLLHSVLAPGACTESPKVESVPKRKRGRPPKDQQKCIQATESASVSSLKPKTEKVLCKIKNDKQKHSNLKPHSPLHNLFVPGVAHKCDSCKSDFQRRLGLIIHRKWRHGIPLPSIAARTTRRLVCWSAFVKYYRPYSISDNPSVGSVYSCPHCHVRRFRQASRCLAHILKLHYAQLYRYRPTKIKLFGSVIRRAASRLMHPCSSCHRVFLHLSNLRSHCSENHQNKGDNYNREIYKKEKQLAREWKCLEFGCGLRFVSVKEIKKHMEIAHSLVMYSCPDCKFTSQVERLFLRHRSQSHGALKMCHVCGKGFHNGYQLKHHLYVCHEVKDPKLKLFKCPEEGCSYECISKNRLDDHSKRHSLSKSFKCETCGKAFKHSIGLERHVKSIHQGIRPYICDQCGLGFGLEHELKTHVIRHSNHKPYGCDHCPFRSVYKANLKYHLYSQHNIENNLKIRIYKCDQCTFRTDSKCRYEDHLKKHKSIKDVQCPECGKMFFSRQNLYGHTMKVHRPKSLCCSYCNFSTAIRSKFKSHMRERHQQLNDGGESLLPKTQ